MSIPQKNEEKVLIIGSGIGGLSLGIILAKLGFDVTVVEKNRQPGGMIRPYLRQGVHCNVGLHYLGALDEGQVLRRCFDFLEITTELPLVRMGGDGPVDRYLFTDTIPGIAQFDVPVGFEAYETNLRTAFPDQSKQITALMTLLQRSAVQIDQLAFLFSNQPTDYWFEQTESLGSLFNQLSCSPGLRAVYGLPTVLIGVPPGVCPQFYHTMSLASYLMSAWRLQEDGVTLAEVCTRRLLSLGARLRTGEAATSIRTDSGRVRGVTLQSGEELEAPIVIGAIHPRMMIDLLDPQVLKPSYRRRILSLKSTSGMVAVQALVPADRHPAIPHNLFAIESEPDGSLRDLIYLQVRPSKARDENLLTLITSGQDETWRAWSQTRSGKRGADYQQKKTEVALGLINKIENIVGPFHNLRIIDVFTPLTIRDWVNSPEGSAYGVMHSTDQLLSAALLNRTSLPGLFLAGQSVLAPGVLGTILGSLVTVKFIIGAERFQRDVRI